MSTDSATASESPTDNDRGALAFSTGDLNTQMMERTTSNISAMSADSMAESADVRSLYMMFIFPMQTITEQ